MEVTAVVSAAAVAAEFGFLMITNSNRAQSQLFDVLASKGYSTMNS